MTDYPSQAPNATLAGLFPTKLADPEKLVRDYLESFATNTLVDGVPALNDPRAGAPPIKLGRGWPAFPGYVPAVGISAGTEGDDHPADTMGMFAGTATAVDDDGVTVLGAADYYAHPIYAPILVMLIHENRDERNRLHNELHRLLRPLTRLLPAMDPQIKQVFVDSEKEEGETGPEVPGEPMVMYVSLFTVHVHHEMLEAADVVDATGIQGDIEVDVTVTDDGA